MPYKRSYQKKGYKSNYARRSKFTKMDKVRKLAGTQPETAVQKIARGVGTVATIAKTVSGIVSMINTEDKYIDNSTSGASVPNNGTLPYIELNAIAQGTDRNQRIGNKIVCKSIQLNFQVFMDPTDTATQRTIRMVLMMDKKPQISVPNFAYIYTPVTPYGLINKDLCGDRFVILKDWKFILSTGTNRVAWKKLYLSLDRIHTQYTGSTATAFETGRIFICGISDVSTAVAAPQFAFCSRFCYNDN